MATFKTRQFIELQSVIANFAETADVHDIDTIDVFVDELILHFKQDNRLFNEKLFRAGCGKRINQHCIGGS